MPDSIGSFTPGSQSFSQREICQAMRGEQTANSYCIRELEIVLVGIKIIDALDLPHPMEKEVLNSMFWSRQRAGVVPHGFSTLSSIFLP